MKTIYPYIISSLLCLLCGFTGHTQSTIIYSENFNISSGGWVTGGYQSSWSYGIPTLPNIASNGTPCFATGDAGVATSQPFTSCLPVSGATTSGNYYNCCERSYIESPVIDLTGVNSPLLKIDINVHCEQTFDGAKMQLSINGGSTWQDIGNYSSSAYQVFPSVINCREKNWYNKNNINYLSGTGGGCGSVNFSAGGSNSGWSGGCTQNASGACLNPDSHGTNGWITASHCLAQAANKPNVKLRVIFGGGSQVYSDGIAIDNIQILDVLSVVNFTSNPLPDCKPAMLFTNTTDCGQSYTWNFGHPAPDNTSTLEHPAHIFPFPGIYTVTLAAKDFCGGESDTSFLVTVGPGNSPVINTVAASSSGICNNPVDTISIILSSPGTGPYQVSYNYNSVPFEASGLTGNPILITGLAPGVYNNIVITDAAGCVENSGLILEIPYNNDSLHIEASGDTAIDYGNTAILSVSANISSTYLWIPGNSVDNDTSQMPLATPESTTTYFVYATDINGCTATDEVTISIIDKVKCNQYFIPNSFTPNGDGKNELFKIYSDPEMRIESYSIKIFDRWGQPVFQSENPLGFWDGDGAQSGIYSVIAQFNCRNKSKSGYSGTLNLIR